MIIRITHSEDMRCQLLFLESSEIESNSIFVNRVAYQNLCSFNQHRKLFGLLLVRFNFNHVCPTRFHCQFEQISWQNETKDFFLSILNDCFIQETLTNFLFHIDLSRNIRDLLLLFDRNPYLTCAVLESNAFSNGNFDGMPSTSSTRIRYQEAENWIKIELVV